MALAMKATKALKAAKRNQTAAQKILERLDGNLTEATEALISLAEAQKKQKRMNKKKVSHQVLRRKLERQQEMKRQKRLEKERIMMKAKERAAMV